MIKGFKDFIMRGNVLDLAVAVVIGAAFTAIVASVVEGFINPLIAAVFGKQDLSSVGTFVINDAQFSIGLILNALVNFLAVAAAVYFLLVYPMQRIQERRKRGEEPGPAEPTDVELLTEIRDLLAARRDG
jgi:large conductance mechanosensitive channel